MLHSNLGKLSEHMDDIELEADTFSFPALFSLFVWILPDPIKSGNCCVVEHDWTVKYPICKYDAQQILHVMLHERISPAKHRQLTGFPEATKLSTNHKQNTPFPCSQRNAYKWPAGEAVLFGVSSLDVLLPLPCTKFAEAFWKGKKNRRHNFSPRLYVTFKASNWGFIYSFSRIDSWYSSPPSA